MRLGIIPTNFLFAAKDGVAVIKNFAVGQVKIFKDAEFKPVVKVDASANDAGCRAVRMEAQCGCGDIGVTICQQLQQAFVIGAGETGHVRLIQAPVQRVSNGWGDFQPVGAVAQCDV